MATSTKRRRYTEAELSQDDLRSPPSKRFKPTPAFWDNLSKIPLTYTALKELERRYALSDRSHKQLKVKKPRTRSAVREFKQKSQPTIPISEYLRKASQVDIALLKAFAIQQRQGGPDLTELRGYQERKYTMSSSLSSLKRRRLTDTSSATSKSRKSTKVYDRAFEQNLIDHGIYLDNRAQKPENWEEIKKRLTNSRSSLSPSKFPETAFEAFQASDSRAKDEDDIMIDIVPVITGSHQKNHFSARKTMFGNLEPLTDGTIAPANPDLFYGARPEQLDRRIRDKLKGRIVPSTMEDKPMAPNFYLEAKGPDGSTAVAKRQACYDGAIGARGMQSLQSYKQDDLVFDGCAYTITSTYNDGQLKMYTTHITPPAGPGKSPEYQMTQINTWGLTGNADTFRQGASAFRNGRDLAKEWREGFISTANERADSLNVKPPVLEPSNLSRPSDTTDIYLAEESKVSADDSASSASSHPVKEPETVYTSFSNPGADDISADELDHTSYAKPIASFKRSGMGSKKTVSKDPRYGASISSRRRLSRNVDKGAEMTSKSKREVEEGGEKY